MFINYMESKMRRNGFDGVDTVLLKIFLLMTL
jgi:hypothetical protein